MEKLDQTVRAMRPFFFALTLLAGPVFFVSYIYMLKLLFQSVPTWLFIAAGLSHIIVWIAASMLHDFQQERQSQQQHGQ